jgi:hypothetical protein
MAGYMRLPTVEVTLEVLPMPRLTTTTPIQAIIIHREERYTTLL